jgi:hypothetical protein
VGILAMLPFVMLEGIGLAILARRSPVTAALAVGFVAYFLVLSGPVAGPKYRLPMEPMLLVLAAIPLAALADRYRKPSARVI